MNNPKETLEKFQGFIAKTYGGDFTPKYRDEVEDAVEAAIPVAELQQQAVELLSEIDPYLTEETYRKIIALRAKIEALP